MSDFSEDNGGAAGPRRFSVLRSWKTAPYLIGSGTAMMGDNIEHVITYWVLWQKFESPALVGFQLISHWLPFLLLSVYAGSLAERFDCRRLIQIGQIMFMVVSLCWGSSSSRTLCSCGRPACCSSSMAWPDVCGVRPNR